MNIFAALNPITRRALRINYKSPMICELVEEASGTGSSVVDTIDVLPTYRAAGPVLSVSVAGGEVTLSWPIVPDAYAYVIYRAESESGPFSAIVSGTTERSLVDIPAAPGTYYYKVTGIEPNFGETEASNVVSATV